MPSFKILKLLAPKKKFLEVLAINGHDGHLSYVKETIIFFINSCPSFPRRLHIKFDFEENLFENNGHTHALSPRARVYNLLMSFFLFHNLKYTVNVAICCNVFPLNDFLTASTIQMHRQPTLTFP